MTPNTDHNGHTKNGSQNWQEAITVDNPYTHHHKEEPEAAPRVVPIPVNESDDDAEEEHGGNRRSRRRLLFVAAIVVLAASVGGGLWVMYGGSQQVEYRIKERKTTQDATQNATAEQATQQAIAQAKQALGGANPETAAPQPQGEASAPRVVTPPLAPIILPDAAPPKVPSESLSGRGEEGYSAQVSRTGAGVGRERASQGRGAPHHGTSSIYAIDAEDLQSARRADSDAMRSAGNARVARSVPALESAAPVLPGFGALLPVKTLGAIYTLRPSLTRLELTRDVEGDGWALKKGTVLVGQVQGSNYDRAYINLVGYLDRNSGKLVKVAGDVLDENGGPGIKGKRRQIHGRWARVFSRVASSAVSLGQAALARGATTVIVGGAAPELASDFTVSGQQEFVEVPASVPAYVLITDLPKEVKGVDPEPVKEEGEKMLTDEEMADLLSSGDREKIRAALPRMSPEMKRLAEQALKEK